MKKNVGLWIDHTTTVMISLGEEGARIKRIRSNIEKHARFSDVSTQPDFEKAMQHRKFTTHLGAYYNLVLGYLRSADTILLFGPGEAKVELEKRLVQAGLGERIVAVETVDNMTDRQIVAHVRQQFSPAASLTRGLSNKEVVAIHHRHL